MPSVNIEKNVLDYIDERGIKIEAVCRATGISRNVIQAVKMRGRKLRADEFQKVCIFLQEDPKRFMEMEE